MLGYIVDGVVAASAIHGEVDSVIIMIAAVNTVRRGEQSTQGIVSQAHLFSRTLQLGNDRFFFDISDERASAGLEFVLGGFDRFSSGSLLRVIPLRIKWGWFQQNLRLAVWDKIEI